MTKTLNDICDFMTGKRRAVKEATKNGKFNFYTSAQEPLKIDECDFTEEAIIINRIGNKAHIHFDKNYCLSKNAIHFKVKEVEQNEHLLKYLFYVLKTLPLEQMYRGSVQQALDVNRFKAIPLRSC